MILDNDSTILKTNDPETGLTPEIITLFGWRLFTIRNNGISIYVKDSCNTQASYFTLFTNGVSLHHHPEYPGFYFSYRSWGTRIYTIKDLIDIEKEYKLS